MISSFRYALMWGFGLMVAMASFSQATPLPADDTNNSLAARASSAWQARHGMTSANYQATFDKLVADKYRLTYVSGYTINNDPRFAAIWERTNGADWVARHGMTGVDYQSQFNALVSKGYRLRLVNGYSVAGSPRYVAIWDKSASPAWQARHGMTSSQYQNAFDTFAKQGYRLRHVSGYSQGNTALYAALWEKKTNNIPWVAHHGMTSSGYQTLFNKYVSQGYRLVDVSGYVVKNVAYYAAIWDKSASGPWVARHGLSSSQYQTEFNNWVGKGYRLKLVSGYTVNSNQDRYAALWIKE
jgi:hypothetical protein